MLLINKNLLMNVSLLGLLIMLSACNKVEQKQDKNIVHPAKIITVSSNNHHALRNFPAKVEANTQSKLAFRVNGQIIHLPIKAGSTVKKGDVLATLDPKDFQLRLDDRKARFQLAQSQFVRAKQLLAKKLIPQSSFDEAKANLSVAQSALNSAKTNLAYTKLIAPFDGSVANVLVKNHETIQAKQTILTLISRDMIDISIQIPENIISRVNKNTNYKPTVIFDSHPDQQFLMSIKEWDTQADPSTLTYKVVFSLPTPKTFNVLPGMSANVRIDLSKVTNDQQAKFLVPVTAVFSDENQKIEKQQSFVWLVNPKTMRVQKQLITLGNITEQGIEVTDGLKEGDKIVVSGVHFLSEGTQVVAWHREKGL